MKIDMRLLHVGVLKKELLDIFRDWRALCFTAAISILVGPVILLMIANTLATFETRSERRIVMVQGLEHSPSLRIHLQRETASIIDAPTDYEAQLKRGSLQDPVLIVPSDFEEKWRNAVPTELIIMSNSANSKVTANANRLKRWLSAFINERSVIESSMQISAMGANELVSIQEHDISSLRAQTSKVFGMIPYFLILACLYSVWSGAVDTTFGEKERRTLEVLQSSPNRMYTIVSAKWLAVWLVGSILVTIAAWSFVPAQRAMPGETLKSMLAYGPVEAFYMTLVLLPLTALLASLLMFAGSVANTSKQAQGSATAIMLIATIFPLAGQIDQSEESWVHGLLPIISQHRMMGRILEGELPAISSLCIACLVSLLLTTLLLKMTTYRLTTQSHRNSKS
jgi:sodium transport system permease protein